VGDRELERERVALRVGDMAVDLVAVCGEQVEPVGDSVATLAAENGGRRRSGAPSP